MLADLSFWQTVAAGAFQVLFTALLVAGIAAFVVKRYELEHQTRTALRETYGELLVAQRRLREASLDLARAGGTAGGGPDLRRRWQLPRLPVTKRRHDRPELERSPDLQQRATSALAAFLDAYHRLNLDATEDMWKDARGLRHVLEDMLKQAEKGRPEACEDLKKVARRARQNLERSFRIRLGHEPLQKRKRLVQPYDKHEEGTPAAE